MEKLELMITSGIYYGLDHISESDRLLDIDFHLKPCWNCERYIYTELYPFIIYTDEGSIEKICYERKDRLKVFCVYRKRTRRMIKEGKCRESE